MSEERIKVWNRTNAPHLMGTSNPLIAIPFPPKAFQMIPLMEVYFVNSTTSSYSSGILEIDPQHKDLRIELGYEQRDPNALDEKELKALLNTFDDEAKEILGGIDQLLAMHKLVDVARSMDLSRSKVKFIEDLTGMTVDDDLIETLPDEKNEAKKPINKGKKK